MWYTYFLGHLLVVALCWDIAQARIVPKLPPPTPSTSPDKIEKDYALGVSKTYLINLDFRRDRLAFISKRLHEVGVPYERFSGVNFFHGVSPLAESVVATRLHPDTHLNLTLIRENFEATVEHRRNWGSTGCWQSHLQVYFDIADGSASFLPGPFLVLEDDIDVADNLDYYLSEDFLTRVVPSDWEMLFLSTRGMTIKRDRVYQLLQAENLTGALSNIKVYKKTKKPHGLTPWAAIADSANKSAASTVANSSGSAGPTAKSSTTAEKGSDTALRGSARGKSKGGNKESKDKAADNKSNTKGNGGTSKR
eukprot:gene14512-10375_t